MADFNLSRDFMKRVAELDDPPCCPACGAMAGCCDKYPDCPGGVSAPSVPERSDSSALVSGLEKEQQP